MSKLLINKLILISPDSKTAKIMPFYNGINIITSHKESGGNYVGKSSILRSVYHTLGADGKFPQMWENEGDYIYILEFLFKNIKYSMIRMRNYFKLLNADNIELFKTSNRDDLGEKLSEIFLQKIFLKAHDGKYKLAHPVYNYLLNYIEQINIELCKFDNFKNLSAFQSIYDDLIYSYLGVNSNRMNELTFQLDKIKDSLSAITERREVLGKMLLEIKKDNKIIDINENLTGLKDELKVFEDKYNKLINKCNLNKKKIYDSIEAKNQLLSNLNELKGFISSKNKNNKTVLKEHVCPICNSQLEDTSYAFFENANSIENFNFQLINVEKELAEVERQIGLLNEKYESDINEIKALEYKIFENDTNVEEKLSSIGIRKIKNNITNSIVSLDTEESSLKEEKNILFRELNEHKKKCEEVDKFYSNTLNEMIGKYRLGGLNNVIIEKANDKFSVDGTRINLASVIWLSSLLKTKYKFNENETIYPLIYDNPNNADFDDENNTIIFKAIFDNLPQDGQIITSCVGFNPEDYPGYTFSNIVVLESPQNQLLNKEDYQEATRIYMALMV